MLASWYEFFSFAAILTIVEPLAGILMLLGMGTNSIGLEVIGLSSLPFESERLSEGGGPQITAVYFTKVKSISKS